MHKLNPTAEQYERLNEVINAHTALRQRVLGLLPRIDIKSIRDGDDKGNTGGDYLRYNSFVMNTPEYKECRGTCHVLTLRAACQDALDIATDIKLVKPVPATRIVQQARSTGDGRKTILDEKNRLKLDHWQGTPIDIVNYTHPEGMREIKAEITRNSRGEFWVKFDYEEIPSDERRPNESGRKYLHSMVAKYGINTMQVVLNELASE